MPRNFIWAALTATYFQLFLAHLPLIHISCCQTNLIPCLGRHFALNQSHQSLAPHPTAANH
ncbi:hypothetical protein T4C_2757 [Trichinella pseudospiralis]|uniref:Uncharacterized protein n=1 Tax=Trichinella pseudospiralis TaxID=6337 RepID=A0A0V1IZZ9_TRIPS|nr:hypothetical protein T4C_2757 [Trichinella pseudospiralis]